MSAAATAETEMVTISLERLKALEALEADLPNIIENAKKEYSKERLKILSERHKANPEAHRQHVIEKYHKNKEEINAKRRERYKAKKEAEKLASGGAGEDRL
jgi:hypothetical protein